MGLPPFATFENTKYQLLATSPNRKPAVALLSYCGWGERVSLGVQAPDAQVVRVDLDLPVVLGEQILEVLLPGGALGHERRELDALAVGPAFCGGHGPVLAQQQSA